MKDLTSYIIIAFIFSLYIACTSALIQYANEFICEMPFAKIKNSRAREFIYNLAAVLPIANLYAIYLIFKTDSGEQNLFRQIRDCGTPDEMARILDLVFDVSKTGKDYICKNCKCLQHHKSEFGPTEKSICMRKFAANKLTMLALHSPECDITKPCWGVRVYKESNKKVLEDKTILFDKKGKPFRSFGSAKKEVERQIRLFHLREFDSVVESENGIEATNLLNEKGCTIYKFYVVICNYLRMENGDVYDETEGKYVKDIIKEALDESNKIKNARKAIYKSYLNHIKEFFRRRCE